MQSVQNRNRLHQIIGLTTIPLRNGARKIASTLCFCLTVVVLLGVADAAAHSLYVGISTSRQRLDASYNKAVDNTDPKNTSTQSGKVNESESNAAEMVFGFGRLLGYRMEFGEDGFFLSGEFDLEAYGGSRVSGNIHEQGSTEGPNQLGESWSEDWNIEREISYGLTLKLGGSPGMLETWKANVYALAGFRRTQTRFDAYYSGCFKSEPCVVGDYESGRIDRDTHYTAWTAGVGVEKMIWKNIALGIEGSYTGYKTEKWVTSFRDLGVEVASESGSHDVGLSLNLVCYP